MLFNFIIHEVSMQNLGIYQHHLKLISCSLLLKRQSYTYPPTSCTCSGAYGPCLACFRHPFSVSCLNLSNEERRDNWGGWRRRKWRQPKAKGVGTGRAWLQQTDRQNGVVVQPRCALQPWQTTAVLWTVAQAHPDSQYFTAWTFIKGSR